MKEKRVDENGAKRRKRAEKRGDDSLDSIGLSDGSPVTLTIPTATTSKHRKSKSESRQTATSTSTSSANALANDRNSTIRSKVHKNDPRGTGPRSSFSVGAFLGTVKGNGGGSKVPAKVTQNDNDHDIR